ncbi:sodium/proton antiporter (CPA1 family) [Paenibacillus taihuensis]|uniref:Sodium/proton antiporter (CPA1 family) n=1 Tax=Paenibacillus taihuensis TaxID=1156355 RepID=A0A3D9SEJ5_9BACL|nr:Na+/H+ antiporter [Paenibacillus taihuensis]REE94348.1 sodium/proton antiporter (CPA1 family) [Paenibacillus taihuensis]
MELFHAVLLMLLMIGFSHVISRFIPTIPSPLILIALGAVVALLPSGVHMELEPELFFILFIAPLLYNDGKHTSRRELWRLRAPILLLAVGLVFVTVLVGGYFIHWLIPTIPLPAAFALAAILSPTDAVAVGALAKRIHMPETLIRLLEGESLMNDASGLVAFNFAIAATVTGVFSMTHAIFSFLVIAVGGLLVGAIVALIIVWFGVMLRRGGLEDVTLHMLIQILTPFVLYLIAEEIGVSGILAAVAGGLVHAIERDRVESSMLRLNIVSNNTWSVLLYVLNGLAFLLLGLQIPHVTSVVWRNTHIDNTQVFTYAFLIFLLLVVLRFVWTFIFTRNQRLFGVEQEQEVPDYKMLLLTSLGGVRGAITLAGAFSIPYVLQSGASFPERDMMIFIAAIVILISLVVASALLPLLSKPKDAPSTAEQNRLEQRARVRILQAAIEALKTEQSPENEPAAISVITDYQKWVQEEAMISHTYDTGQPRCRDTETQLRLKAIDAERRCVKAMVENGTADPKQAMKVTEMLDQMELVLTKQSRMWRALVKLFMKKVFARDHKRNVKHHEEREAMKALKICMCQSAIAELGVQKRPEIATETNYVISQYKQMLGRLSLLQGSRASEDLEQSDIKKEMYWVAIQAERDMVQTMYESGEITRELASDLRGTIRDRETAISEIM